MKHTLKKLLAFSLVLALVAGMLVGCGGAPSSSAANSTSASVEATSSAGGKGENPNAGRENVTIRVSQYANNTDDQEYMANDPIKKAIEEAVNVTIEYDTGIEGYDDRLATELAVGAAPDLFPTWGVAPLLRKYAEEEAVYDIGKIIKEQKKTAILVTHDISEAISMGDCVVILSHRPAHIKKVVNINLSIPDRTPFTSRQAPEFAGYFNEIWEDIQ